MSENFHECHWGQCLELVSHLCEYSDNILLVSGPEGIGKTTLKQELIKQEADQFVICEINGTNALTAEQLTIQIEQHCDIDENKDLLILIDDAQNLALDVIAIIFQLRQKAADIGRLHIVLFANEEFERKVSRSVLKEDFAEQVHAIEIEPLTVSEVESFLIQQWRLHHHNTEMPLNRAKCKKIYAMSGGIPGKIQELAANMLNDKPMREGRGEHSLSPVAVGITVSFGILFCILAVMWPSADKELLNKTTNQEQPLTIAKEESTAEQPTVQLAEVAVEPAAPEMVLAENKLPAEPMHVIEQIPVINKVETIDEKIARLENKIDEMQKQLSSEQKALRVAEQKLQQLSSSSSRKAVVAPVAAAKSAGKVLTLVKQEKKILALPSTNYTLQLISMNKEDQAKDFIKKNKLQDKAQYFKGHFKGKDWYTVVYGNYSSKLDAQVALSSLPTNLKKLRPMMREYGNIHHAINNRGKHE